MNPAERAAADAGSATAAGEQALALLRIENAGLRARIADLESRTAEPDAIRAELEEARRRNEEMRRDRRALDREIVELRSLVAEAERQLGGIRQTFIYRIGEAIVSARGWKGLRQLPRRLISLRRAWLEKRAHAAASGVAATQKLADRLRYVDETMTVLASQGLEAAVAHVRTLPERHAEEKARTFVELAQAVRPADSAQAVTLGLEAAKINPIEPRLRALTLGLYDQGELSGPARLLQASGDGLMSRPADVARKSVILAQSRQLEAPVAFPVAVSTPATGAARLAVIGERSLPQHADAQTFRAQAVMDAAHGRGYEAVLITAPGYQYPKGGDGGAVHRTIGSIPITRLPQADAPSEAYDSFVAEVGAALAAVFLRRRITHVHATAGITLAAAALWGARRAGARFVLDVGAFPIAGENHDRGWENTERSRAALSLFSQVARGADQVIVRSPVVARGLADRGLLADFDSVDDVLPPSFAPAGADRIGDVRRELGLQGQRLIGVFDAIDLDPGLTDLVRALPVIRGSQPDAAILFCGSGKGAQPLLQLAARLGVADRVIVPSGFVRQRTPDYLSAFSAAVFPKHRTQLAANSAAFELQAAMAVAAPIVAADTPWSRGWVLEAQTGLLTQPGDVAGLATAVARLLEDRALASRLGAAARQAVTTRADRRVIDPLVLAAMEGRARRPAA